MNRTQGSSLAATVSADRSKREEGETVALLPGKKVVATKCGKVDGGVRTGRAVPGRFPVAWKALGKKAKARPNVDTIKSERNKQGLVMVVGNHHRRSRTSGDNARNNIRRSANDASQHRERLRIIFLLLLRQLVLILVVTFTL